MISDSEKKILLERLALARAAKVAKKAEKDAASKAIAVAPTPAPAAPAPPAVPAPAAPTPRPAPTSPAAPDTDDEELAALPKRMRSKPIPIPEKREKAAAYMKIKIYSEPKNPERLNQLLLAVNGNEADDCNELEQPEPVYAPAAAAPPVKPPRQLVQHQHSYPLPKLVLNNDWARKELLRRQAIEFFA